MPFIEQEQWEQIVGANPTRATKFLAYAVFAYVLTNGLLIEALAPLGTVIAVLFLVAWLGAPVAMWYDTAHVREQTGWPHHRVLYSIGAFIPSIIGLVVMAYYLLERKKRLQGTGGRRGPQEQPVKPEQRTTR